MRLRAPDTIGGVHSNATENGQINPSSNVRAAQGAGSLTHRVGLAVKAGKARILRQIGSHPGNPGSMH
jgi:hypothetical protein